MIVPCCGRTKISVTILSQHVFVLWLAALGTRIPGILPVVKQQVLLSTVGKSHVGIDRRTTESCTANCVRPQGNTGILKLVRTRVTGRAVEFCTLANLPSVFSGEHQRGQHHDGYYQYITFLWYGTTGLYGRSCEATTEKAWFGICTFYPKYSKGLLHRKSINTWIPTTCMRNRNQHTPNCIVLKLPL